MIIIAAVLAALAAGFCALGVYAGGTETIFPNVTADGVFLGGMTTEEAEAKLSDLGWDKKISKSSVTVLLPFNRSITVKAADVNAFVTAEQTVQLAFEYGHNADFFTAGLKYVKSLISGAAITLKPDLDTAETERIVSEAVAAIRADMMGSGYDIDEEAKHLLVVKGAKSVELDEKAITDLVIAALQARKYDDIGYDMNVDGGEEINIAELYDSVRSDAADAYYDKESRSIVPSVTGFDFNKERAKTIWEKANYGETVEIPLTVTPPTLSTETLTEHLLGDELSTLTTSLAGSTADRISNVALACEKINGTVLEPGDVFSYNDALGQRTLEAGFKYAGAYSEGQVVQEIGGGICQLSSMIYYCEMHANLTTRDRTCHYFPVAYVSPGFDATVSWTKPDFKFENTSQYPVKILASVNREENTVTVTFMGTNLTGEYVKMTFVSWAVYGKEEYPDIATGYKAATYRWVYDKDDILLTKGIETYSQYHYHEEDLDFPESPSPSPEASSAPAGETPPPTVEATPAPTAEVTPAPTQPVEGDAQNAIQ